MPVITSLVSYWSLDEASGNRADSHGSNTLTDNNTVGSAAAVVSNGASFNAASSESLTVADNASLDLTGLSFTYAFWVDTTMTPAGEVGLIVKDGDVLITMTDSFTVTFSVFDSVSSFTQAAHGSLVNDGNPHFVVCQYNHATDKKARVSVDDGAYAVAGTGLANGPAHTSSSLGFGTYAGGQFFTGVLDEAGFWTKAISDAEKTWLYNAGAGRSYAAIVAESGGGSTAPRVVTKFVRRIP